jgi:hypothetical protein
MYGKDEKFRKEVLRFIRYLLLEHKEKKEREKKEEEKNEKEKQATKAPVKETLQTEHQLVHSVSLGNNGK